MSELDNSSEAGTQPRVLVAKGPGMVGHLVTQRTSWGSKSVWDEVIHLFAALFAGSGAGSHTLEVASII